ncbi:MAG: hypothetical protein CMM84_20115 [Rhodothermaceae bacterium]|nr:hypothetical protein [Rhodothermaceae bacterium]MBC13093.1 hypothetical protein [Rhodothermaceae bacterium]
MDVDADRGAVEGGVVDGLVRDPKQREPRFRRQRVLVEVQGDRDAGVALPEPVDVGGECGGEAERSEGGRTKRLAHRPELLHDSGDVGGLGRASEVARDAGFEVEGQQVLHGAVVQDLGEAPLVALGLGQGEPDVLLGILEPGFGLADPTGHPGIRQAGGDYRCHRD